MNRNRVACLLAVFLLPALPAGTENIDPVDDDAQFAWAENVGWFNAEPLGERGPGIHVGDFELTGWFWGENIGWVSASCKNTMSCNVVGRTIRRPRPAGPHSETMFRALRALTRLASGSCWNWMRSHDALVGHCAGRDGDAVVVRFPHNAANAAGRDGVCADQPFAALVCDGWTPTIRSTRGS